MIEHSMFKKDKVERGKKSQVQVLIGTIYNVVNKVFNGKKKKEEVKTTKQMILNFQTSNDSLF